MPIKFYSDGGFHAGIQKKNFIDDTAAYNEYMTEVSGWSISFSDWMKQKGHTIGSQVATKVAHDAALQKLRQFLNASEPELVYWLQNNWTNQSNAITYKELREAIMTGSLDQQMIYDWQQDYSKFVTDHLRPAWENAMAEANAQLSEKYPLYSFDPGADGVKQWLDTKAASFVTNSTMEQIKAINAVVAKAAVLQDLTVDGLSRAIRPMVGLTYQQGIANLNYYKAMVDSGLSEKVALERSIKYSARQSRYRGYNIARTELAFAYNKGEHFGVQQAIDQGLMGYTRKVWCTADDERVCEICGGLEGKTIEMDEDFDFYTKLAANNPGIRQTPPAHPSCRCTCLYEEVAQPDYAAWNAQHAQQNAPEPQQDDYSQPAIPEANIPDVADLTLVGPSQMGGTSESYIYQDSKGDKYLFKVAKDKYKTNVAPFRAHIQEAGYKVQYIVDPETAVDVKAVTINGKFGAIQRIIDKTDNAQEIKDWYFGAKKMSGSTIAQLQREHVTDWLLGNFDSHINNFVTDKHGRLIGLDKEQAMKYIKDKKSHVISVLYHPNKAYGEYEPVYNKLYKAYANDAVDMDLNDVLPYIKRVEAISDKEYREIFREYAESLHGKGKAAEELLDEIVERKRTLRETYRTFYEELLEQKTGKKVSFVFLDEGKTAAKQTLSVITMTEEAASKLSLAELKKIAKDNGVPNFGNMTKKQLITCVSDPSKIEDMSNQVKAKLQAQAAKRKAQAMVASEATKPVSTTGIRMAEDVFKDLDDAVPAKVNGISVRADFDAVEGQQLNIRKIILDGEDYIEINGKFTDESWQNAKDMLRNMGAKDADFIYEAGKVVDDVVVFNSNSSPLWVGEGLQMKVGNTIIEVANDRNGAQLGLFRIRTLASGPVTSLQVETALRRAGIEYIKYNPTQEAEQLMKKVRVLWQQNPKLASQFSTMKNKLADIDHYLKMAGIDPDKAGKLILEEVFDGYSTYMDYEALTGYQKAGLRYVWAGVREGDSVVAMVKSGGMQATKKRMANGFMGNGSSMTSDIRTGGADSVFTRIATNGAYKGGKEYRSSYCGGNYQILMKDSTMARTDWYAYTSDCFGDISHIPGNNSAIDFVKKMEKSYYADNEIMFRNGIRLDEWIGIDTKSDRLKAELINKLQKEGIDTINGVPLDKFIRVNTLVGKPLK